MPFAKTVLGLLVLCLLQFSADRAQAERRVALVIGNSAYQNVAPLKNPRNDATDIAETLKRLGFEVVEGFDLDSNGFRSKLRDFSSVADKADVALFYYAGHAMQVKGVNYLAPVDTALEREADLDFETIELDFILRQMERSASTILVFLDSCRDNPLTRRLVASSRSAGVGNGLARPQSSAQGLFIAFSTEPNKVALDGKGRNSPFTAALLKNIERPGIEISALMTDVRREVFDTTNKEQLPFTNSGLLGQFYFNAAPPAQETRPPEKVALSRLPDPRAGYTRWMPPGDYQAFFNKQVKLRQFPTEVECSFVDNAYWMRAKFVDYPRKGFGFYSYTGMTEKDFAAKRQKLSGEGFQLSWMQSFNNGKQNLFCATWTK